MKSFCKFVKFWSNSGSFCVNFLFYVILPTNESNSIWIVLFTGIVLCAERRPHLSNVVRIIRLQSFQIYIEYLLNIFVVFLFDHWTKTLRKGRREKVCLDFILSRQSRPRAKRKPTDGQFPFLIQFSILNVEFFGQKVA